VYFNRADPTVINQAVRGGKRDLLLSFVYGYSHVLVFGGVTAADVGIQAAIETAATGTGMLALPGRVALGGGFAVALLGVALVHRATPHVLQRSLLLGRLVVAGLCLALVVAGGFISSSTLAGLFSVSLLGLVLFEAWQSPQPEPTHMLQEEGDLLAS
jgi:low temperature requirement protein LtrA